MADLIIGGNTYQNIEYVKIKRADGTIATFFDTKDKEKLYMSGSVSYKKGLAHLLSASVNLGTITATAYRVVE